jgi:cell division protein FtsI/penicillin-binding protein 2
MNVFRHISTFRARRAASHEIDPEDVFLDSENISNFDMNQMQGQLERPLGKHVFYIALLFSIALMGLFSYRLFALQIVEGDAYRERADNNHLRKIPLFALRGTISDRNGELLAWNSTTDTVGTSSASATPSNNDIPKRVYIKDSGFSHLLGYVSYPKRDQSGVFWQDEYIGKDGVEKQYQEALAGVRGERLIEVTARHAIEAENVVVYPSHGENVVLTIDAGVQKKLHETIRSLTHE